MPDFNPRSREGSDGTPPWSPTPTTDFNPRSREGSDQCRSSPGLSPGNFNPRSREGSDQCRLTLDRVKYGFQSTLP